jgi:hypothetical protein
LLQLDCGLHIAYAVHLYASALVLEVCDRLNSVACASMKGAVPPMWLD